MTSSSPELRPGGTAYRALELLKQEPPWWRKATDLAETLEVMYPQLYSSMQSPVLRGILSRFTFDGAVCFGLPGKEPEGAVMPDGRRVRGDGTASAPGLGWHAPAAQQDEAEEPNEGLPEGPIEAPTAKRGFACALFSDGRWLLEFDGASITLPPEYAERMFSYVGRVWQRAKELEDA
jgi:hypothetical protein